MLEDKTYKFVATTAGHDEVDDVTTVYVADHSGEPYFTLQRTFSASLPEPEDLYLEYGDQCTGCYGSLKKLTLTRSRVDALIENGISINAQLQITDDEWRALQTGFDKLLEGLEPFIQRH